MTNEQRIYELASPISSEDVSLKLQFFAKKLVDDEDAKFNNNLMLEETRKSYKASRKCISILRN